MALDQKIVLLGKRIGFSKALFTYSCRTAFASCLALICGWCLGLDHPQWAAMSVWAATVPLQKRGMLLEKSLLRLTGTMIGTVVGMMILYLSDGEILYVAIGLTVWITICTGAGNLINGLFSYLTLLSGYTASLVLVLEMTQGDSIYALGLDRMLTVSVGLVTAMLVGLIFAKPSCEILTERVKKLTHDTLIVLHQATFSPISEDKIVTLIKEAASIEALLDAHGAGSLTSRRSVRSIRAIIYVNISFLTSLTSNTIAECLRPIEPLLAKLVDVVKDDKGLRHELICIEAICQVSNNNEIQSTFQDLHVALTQRLLYREKGRIIRTNLHHMTLLHRDWVAAGQSMLRTFLVLGTIGIVWNYTGAAVGGFVMLGTSVMISLFSTFEAPAQLMKRMIVWQSLGLVASLLVKSYFWQHASSELECVLWMSLFILPIIIPMSLTRFSIGTLDYVMMFLLLSNIEYPIQFDLSMSLAFGGAAVGGGIVALMAFSLIFPTNAVKRKSRVKDAIYRDLQRVRRLDPHTKKKVSNYHKANHRLLKLIQSDTMLTDKQLFKTAKVVSLIKTTGNQKKCSILA